MFLAARGKACVDPVFFMYYHCWPAFLPPFVYLFLFYVFSMLPGARPVWNRYSLCTLMICLLSYRPLNVYSHSEFFSVAKGKACVDPVFVMYVHCSPAVLPPFASVLLLYTFQGC